MLTSRSLDLKFTAILAAFALPVSTLAVPTPATVDQLSGMAGIENCSASIVALSHSDDDAAYLLTAGHCPKGDLLIAPGKAYALPAPADTSRTLWKHTYGFPAGSTLTQPHRISVDSLVYATMTNVDTALFRTKKTVGEMRADGYRIFTLGETLPNVGTSLRVTSAFWKSTQICEVSRIFRDTAEEVQVDANTMQNYSFRNSILFDDGCTITAGWSGSPIFDDAKSVIYGVGSRLLNRTLPRDALRFGAIDLLAAMAWNVIGQPDGTLVASNVVDLLGCIGADGKMRLAQPGCELPPIDPNAEPGVSRGSTPPTPTKAPPLPSKSGSTWPSKSPRSLP